MRLKSFIFFPVLIFMLFLLSCQGKKHAYMLNQLTCELRTNPVGIDTQMPRFSWELADTGRGAMQTAYQIIVATSEKNLTEKKADVWNSGKVESGQSTLIPYSGPSLQSATIYYWKAKIWDGNGESLGYSSTSSWETGLLNTSDWKASWIGFKARDVAGTTVPENTERLRSILLRKDFNLSGKVKKARVYISGLGSYVLYLNGKKVGDDLFRPGWTDYRRRVQYQVYDITSMLNQGENAAGIMLGNMWWTSGLGWNGAAVYSKGPLRAIMQIQIEYTNGKTEVFGTDKSWKGQLSPVTDNSIYHGETYDARLEIPVWAQPGLQDEKWYEVGNIPMENIEVSAATGPPIRINEELMAQKITEVRPGIFVFDYGTNLVGAERLKVSGSNGDTVVMKFAELLHDDGTVAQENLRSAKATDRYILKGVAPEVWEPSFTYHGFRYIQVEGFPGTPEKENLIALRFNSDAEVTGHFECSNPLLNKIWQNVLNGQKGNLMSVPTDCPQRDERLGWMGDAQIFAPTASYNMNMMRFFEKWMRDITDSQDKSGFVYDVNPAIVVEGPAKAGWGDAITAVPWVVYNFYGDKKILSENYEGMKAWVEYMRRKSIDHIYRWSDKAGDWEGYGDWISVEKSPTEPISAAYYYYSTKVLSNAAGILGKKDEHDMYGKLADSIALAFQDKFYQSSKKNYPGETQTANLIPLTFGITPDTLREVIAENVEKNVVLKGYHPSTGFLGTPLLLPVLSEYGYNDVAYKTAISEEYPSWGYMLKKGATTMWELWNSDSEPPQGMNSRNHFALGSVVEWYYGYLAGIRPLEPGFKKALIAPMPPDGLEHAAASLKTLYGELSDSWTRSDADFTLVVNIPANTTALVRIPNLFPGGYTLSESGTPWLDDGKVLGEESMFTLESTNANTINVNLSSGNYTFNLNKK